MYLSLRDRPAGSSASRRASSGDAAGARTPGIRRPAARVSSVVVSLGVVSLLTDISSESVAAILPLYVTAALGLSTIAYGFIDGLMQGATALVRIAGGWAADRGDHPKWVAFAGYGLASHKGYSTKAHQAALVALGPSRLHRRSFAPVAAALDAG